MDTPTPSAMKDEPDTIGTNKIAAMKDEPDTLGTINKVVTIGRLVWVLLVIGSGGFGTGVGFLLGEGSARATFAAQYEQHDKRIAAAEGVLAAERVERAARVERDRLERTQDLEAERKERDRIIEKINEVGGRIANVEGALKIIAENVKPRRSP